MDSIRPRILLLSTLIVMLCGSESWGDFPTEVQNDNPIGYWRLNETTGRTAVNIGSFAGFDAKLHAGELGVAGAGSLADGTPLLGMGGRDNAAFSIAGPDSFIGTDRSAMNGLQEFTILGWVFPDARQESRIGLWGQNDVVEMGFIEPNQIQVYTATGGTLDWVFDPTTEIMNREWVFLAATGNGQELNLFLNGESVATGGKPIVGNYGSSNFPFNIGGGGIFDEQGNQLRGVFDEVALFDRALPADRIHDYFRNAVADGPPGDFNFDDKFDVKDVNLLSNAIATGSKDTLFDLDGTDVIDTDDLDFWVKDIKFTWIGDANLDGQFNSSDFVLVFQNGEYEDEIDLNSGWADGDWNADLEFDSSDFVAAFQDGGYELGAPPAVAQSVPEPRSAFMLMLALGGLAWVHARNRRRLVPVTVARRGREFRAGPRVIGAGL